MAEAPGNLGSPGSLAALGGIAFPRGFFIVNVDLSAQGGRGMFEQILGMGGDEAFDRVASRLTAGRPAVWR